MLRALFLSALLCSAAALAQDDDLPALPVPSKAKPKPKPKPAAPKQAPKQKAPVADDDLPALPTAQGQLLVKMSGGPKNAKLSIDDKEIGALPQPAQAINVGEHTVTVHRAGFTPFTKKVTINGNKTTDVNVTLEASSAVLAVSADVIGAQVYVNGRFAGTAPVEELEVPPGKVELSVKKDGYRDNSQTVTVKAGHDYPIEMKLGAPVTAVAANEQPPPPELVPQDTSAGQPSDVTSTTQTYSSSGAVYQQWWFWTVIAAVVVGGVVLASYFGVSGSQPKSTPLTIADFMCMSPGCAGWINKPSAIVPYGH
jgi:hypothetical protein